MKARRCRACAAEVGAAQGQQQRASPGASAGAGRAACLPARARGGRYHSPVGQTQEDSVCEATQRGLVQIKGAVGGTQHDDLQRGGGCVHVCACECVVGGAAGGGQCCGSSLQRTLSRPLRMPSHSAMNSVFISLSAWHKYARASGGAPSSAPGPPKASTPPS